ncbi:hypothetical protein CVV68_22370 [Arthrobacter livingstonensis]|uniref:Uncharacterized protein n=1 Tax=Arthrobacter livingstonensis TaxID=670078 RepID=A0A2V5L1A5_9MICC|nr:hypothetical protein CVV68_22370 [Arthrobacter livingstonensis]
MRSQTTESLELLITEPGQLYELLDDAEAKLQRVAMAQRCAGILVTRHGPSRYSLALSDTVPFGETWEHTLS